MCGPEGFAISQAVLNAASSITTNVISYKQEKAQNEYRAQAAINNIKAAENKARNLEQTGLEEARKERIKGIREAQTKKAQYSASGFDINSETYSYNIDDILNNSENSANTVQNRYNTSADGYRSNIDNYLSQYRFQQKNYNLNQYKNAINALGNYTDVASSWYQREDSYV